MFLFTARRALGALGVVGLLAACSAEAEPVATQPPTSVTTTASSAPAPSASTPAPAAPAPDGPRFGAAYKVMKGETPAAALARTEQSLGSLDVVRVFYSGAPEPWPGKAPGRPVVVSFKLEPRAVVSGEFDAELTEWFSTAPRELDVHWSYWHEPENDIQEGKFSASEFKAAFTHVAELARTANNPRLKATLVLQSFTTKPESGRNWRDYYPGDAVDVFAWDVYNRPGKTGVYSPPAELMGAQVAASKSVGKPFAVAELGSVLATGDDGARRADWLRKVGAYLKQQDAVFVLYFDLNFNGGRDDFRLRDPASTRAWKEVTGG